MAEQIQDLYRAVIAAWNNRDGQAMAKPFATDAIVIGFEGSIDSGEARSFPTGY